MVVAFLYAFLMEGMGESDASFVWSLVYMAIQLVISMGVIKAYLNIVRGQKVTTQTFTSAAPDALKYIAAQILLGLIVLGGLILFIVPGIYFAIKYMFTPYLVIDKGMGPIEALKASGDVTKGIKWDLIGFFAAAIVLTYSGILALFVGLIITIPVATLSYVVLYDLLLRRLK